jgi:hypothetical protein
MVEQSVRLATSQHMFLLLRLIAAAAAAGAGRCAGVCRIHHVWLLPTPR